MPVRLPSPLSGRRGAVTAVLVLVLSLLLAVAPAPPPPSAAPGPGREPPAGRSVATGHGGAVASVNPYASRAGLEVLRAGGNA
ncbi:MAG TPA: hypothetical protein VFY14_15930, partial [Streptomyces sp.]|nr:hypothetical protein [Streptomyces sp.]